MINLIFSLPRDAKEAAKIEKLRALEEKRKERIFNPRNRLIGVDKDALDKQIAEKKARDEEDKSREDAFQLKLLRDDEIAKQMEKGIQEKQRQLNEEVNNYRLIHQRKEDRREFDLNDPDYLKKGLPCRVLDDDPRLSISGAQKFEGEDMNSKERRRYQTEQQRVWLQQQIDERIRLETEKKQAESAYSDAVLARDQRAKQLESLEGECRKQLEETTARFNLALAAEQATQKRMQEMRDLEDKRAEIYNCITSDLLTENPEVATSCLGPNRIVGSSYKGMPPNEKEAFLKDMLKQIEENKKRREEEKKTEADWGQMINYFASTATMNNTDTVKKQREINRQLLEENKQLSLQQKRVRELEEKMLRSVGATEEFYDQFNRSTR